MILLAAALASASFEQLRTLAPDSVPVAVPIALPAPVPEWTDFPLPLTLTHRALIVSEEEDLDRDGLADAAEAELARLVRPYHVFSSQENALRPGEPGTVFQVRPSGCSGPRSRCRGKDLSVAVRYLNLWQRDGGYGKISWCGDSHLGDNQTITVNLVSSDDGNTFRVDSVDNGAFLWPTKSGAVRFKNGTHPEIFYSAGKHHQFFDASFHGRAASYTSWGCKETLDAKGPKFLSVLRGNVGEPERHDGFVDDLAPFGFPGENAWGTKPFCGGLKCAADNPTSTNAGNWNRGVFFVPPGPRPPY